MIDKGRVQFITDPRPNFNPVEQARMVCARGISWVQLRMKNSTREEKLRMGKETAAVAHKHDAVFIVNDDVDLAAELGADGIHLGLDDEDPAIARKMLGRKAIIGGTCNTMEDIRLRKSQGVDYIGLGPYRFTSTKKRLSPILGLQGMVKIMQQCREEDIDIPVVAIGGIRVEDIAGLKEAGLHGVAVSSLIIDAADTSIRIQEIQEKIR